MGKKENSKKLVLFEKGGKSKWVLDKSFLIITILFIIFSLVGFHLVFTSDFGGGLDEKESVEKNYTVYSQSYKQVNDLLKQSYNIKTNQNYRSFENQEELELEIGKLLDELAQERGGVLGSVRKLDDTETDFYLDVKNLSMVLVNTLDREEESLNAHYCGISKLNEFEVLEGEIEQILSGMGDIVILSEEVKNDFETLSEKYSELSVLVDSGTSCFGKTLDISGGIETKLDEEAELYKDLSKLSSDRANALFDEEEFNKIGVDFEFEVYFESNMESWIDKNIQFGYSLRENIVESYLSLES